MKTRTFLFIGLLLLNYSFASSKEAVTGNNPSQQGSLNVVTSPDLYNLTLKWADAYCSLNPDLKINVIQSEDKGIAAALTTNAGIGIINDHTYAALGDQSLWSMVVGRDVIVAVMNDKNPALGEIYRQGITSDRLAIMLENPENRSWGKLLGNNQDIPVHIYTSSDAAVISGLQDFLKTTRENAGGIKPIDGKELISAVRNDPYALGFCKLNDIIDQDHQNFTSNIKLVPIDKNNNGKIDYMEEIYSNLQDFSRGVWIGKYPKALTGGIYSVSSAKPNNEAEIAFLRWIVTEGQNFLSPSGYCDLVSSERQTQLDKITDQTISFSTPEKSTNVFLKVVFLVVILFAVAGLIIDLVIRNNRAKKDATTLAPTTFPNIFNEDSVNVPKGIYFDKTHTWAFMEKDGSVKVGIDDFLQHVTGPLSRIGMKPAGVKVKKGEPLLTIIQNGKHLTIYSPVSGTIISSNETLMTNSATINAAPYTDGWVYMIEPSNWIREIQFLSMAEQYRTWLKDEFSRLKDFIASALKVNTPEYAHVVLQDGGVLKDSILAEFGPEVWEDFQTNFIDNTKL